MDFFINPLTIADGVVGKPVYFHHQYFGVYFVINNT